MKLNEAAEAYAKGKLKKLNLKQPYEYEMGAISGYLAGHADALKLVLEAVKETIAQMIVDSGADCIQTTDYYLKAFCIDAELPQPPQEKAESSQAEVLK